MAFSDPAGARANGRAVNPVKFPGRTVRGWQEAAAILRLAGVVACMGTGGGGRMLRSGGGLVSRCMEPVRFCG
jgi:hypothetical protein